MAESTMMTALLVSTLLTDQKIGFGNVICFLICRQLCVARLAVFGALLHLTGLAPALFLLSNFASSTLTIGSYRLDFRFYLDYDYIKNVVFDVYDL